MADFTGGSGRRPKLKLRTPQPLTQSSSVTNSPLQQTPTQKGPFNPKANISGGIGRRADANDAVFGVPAVASAPEYNPVEPDRGEKRKARRRAISSRFGDDDSGKAWLE